MKWGNYLVLRHDRDSGDPSYVKIFSHSGKLDITVDADYILFVNTVEVNHGKEKALLIGGHRESTGREDSWSYLFVQRHSLRNIGLISGSLVTADRTFVDGYPNLVDDKSQVFELAADFCNACSPDDIPIVFAWNGKYYSEATRRFPDESLKLASKYRRSFYSDLGSFNLDDTGRKTELSAEFDLATYYGNMAMVGRSGIAARWIIRHAPKDVRLWFLTYKSDFDERIKVGRSTGFQSNQTVYDGNADGPWL